VLIDPIARLADVPEFTEFPTVDELVSRCERIAENHPDIASTRRIGTSRLGEALRCLTIQGGDAHAVVFGSVHPNEPIGNLTALHLAETLCADAELRAELGYTWHIIPCIDPDGTRLNEGWFAGPFDRAHYGRNFYRPAPNEQVEWTFPFAYKDAYFDRMMSETQALMRLIDDTKPAFMCSLHNGELGGIYYYLSRSAPQLYDTLHAIPAALGLPLDTGEPEVPYVERFAPAIFHMIRSSDQYDFAESLGLEAADRDCGESSASYAEKYGTMTLVTEVPYWSHPDIDDQTETADRYSDVLRRRGAGLTDMTDRLAEILAAVSPDLSTESPYLRASRAFIPSISRTARQDAGRAAAAQNDRPATVAERFACADLVHCFRLRYGGMLLRALDGELAVGNGTPAIREQHAALAETYQQWCDEARKATPAETIPIGKLVAVQFGAILATATHIRSEE
jgi:hypothetical protein